MCEGSRVDNDGINIATSFVYAVHNDTFMVGLQMRECDGLVVALLPRSFDDLRQRSRAVYRRLTCPQQIEVGTVDEEDRFGHVV